MLAAPSFGSWIKERRKALDLTQSDLAERTGCSTDTIYRFEAGTRRPSKQIAARLAMVLQIPADQTAAFLTWARGEPSSGRDGEQAVGSGMDQAMVDGVPRRPGAFRVNLPAHLPPLVGREQE